MRAAILLLVAGCAGFLPHTGERPPVKAAAIEFRNEYAESIFKYDIRGNYSPNDDVPFRLQSGQTYRMADAMLLPVPAGSSIVVNLDVQSLGRWSRFEIETTFVPGGTFKVHYAWDMATAQFRAGGAWLGF